MVEEIIVRDKSFVKLIDHERIQIRIRSLAAELEKQFPANDEVLLVGVLNGAFMFFSDLVKAINRPVQLCFVQLKSYHGMHAGDSIDVVKDMNIESKGKHIVLIEDIIDSGKTLHTYVNMLRQRDPASISIYSLLVKPNKIQYPLPAFTAGFEIADEFVIGYGLDYDEEGRNLSHIYQVKEL